MSADDERDDDGEREVRRRRRRRREPEDDGNNGNPTCEGRDRICSRDGLPPIRERPHG
jgi:hypothetical protein